MDVDPAVGKILGMVMAYAVSALGLLLAYYNYRKRVVKAEYVFSRRAQVVLWTIGVGIALALILGAAAMNRGDRTRTQAIFEQLPGIIVPGAVFVVSFWITWKLYRRFSRKAR